MPFELDIDDQGSSRGRLVEYWRDDDLILGRGSLHDDPAKIDR